MEKITKQQQLPEQNESVKNVRCIRDSKEWCEDVRHSSSDESVSLDMSKSSVFVDEYNGPTLLTIAS